MFQSFTGNARRVRQVNLSGRNANAFGGPPAGPRTSQSTSGPQNTLANAQQERLSRQRERERLEAARKIQRVWRGLVVRWQLKSRMRRQWDDLEQYGREESLKSTEAEDGFGGPFLDPERCVAEMRLLTQFVDTTNEKDLKRLDWFTAKLLRSQEEKSIPLDTALWKNPLWRFSRVCLRALASQYIFSPMTDRQLSLLTLISTIIPAEMAQMSSAYYRSLASLITGKKKGDALRSFPTSLFLQAVLIPLRNSGARAYEGYEGFARSFLTTADLQTHFADLDALLSGLDFHMLCGAMRDLLDSPRADADSSFIDREGKLWLLGYFIHFQSSLSIRGAGTDTMPDIEYVDVVSILLRSLADEISKRIDVDDSVTELQPQSKGTKLQSPLPAFVRHQLLSLVNQQNVTSLLRYADVIGPQGTASSSGDASRQWQSRLLASYALTLLRIFPRKADEIRMWLYLGSVNVSSTSSESSGQRLPTVRLFWEASRRTGIFTAISQDPKAAVNLLRSSPVPSTEENIEANQVNKDTRDQEWRIILIFFELYGFVLKVMDDEEFFSATPLDTAAAVQGSPSWTRQSALPLNDVQELTVFLKNLGFTLYWQARDIAGIDQPQTADDIRTYFNIDRVENTDSQQKREPESKPRAQDIAGVTGMTVDYIKGIVTGLLRMVYERDSRRRFLPRDHWLMTGRFDMEAFIPAVVSEEESRHRIQDADGEDGDGDDEDKPSDEEQQSTLPDNLIGTYIARRTQTMARLRRQQRKASRKRYLEVVTPRLEILQNMPFFLPFATRVQIFRRFVHWDQHRRRGGYIDGDQWRLSLLHGQPFARLEDQPSVGSDIINRHHAKIRRESLFEDAYDQFYGLGDGLKEPIQITFVDKFDTIEAGIDGGGVTKEFLTSVTNEAFSSSNGLDLFVENDQNLLYPNPAAVDERKDILNQAGIGEKSPEWNDSIRELLRRYEFLGRVIGKCLYEGILVDVGFAPHFLLKWALTGGSKAASRESSYRANLNDLRDLDEGLYQGLLQLKNYPGNVEDFSLNFTITDTISTPRKTGEGSSTRTITRDLRPNGSNIPVTNENRLFYISYVARHRLQVQPRAQTNAFLRGLGEIIQPEWLAMLNQSELQTLVGGDASEIDVADLRRNTLYGGVYTIGDDHQEHPSIQLFWQVMHALSDPERRKVLKFVTSTPRGPLLGFGQLNPRFSIRDAGADQDRLPSTSTCVNLLKLPRYNDPRILEEKLMYAVNSGAGFDLS